MAQSLCSTHERIQLCQHGIGGVHGLLLCTRHLHLRLHLFFSQQRQLAKTLGTASGCGTGSEAGVWAGAGRTAISMNWASAGSGFCADFQQRHRVIPHQRRAMLVQQAPRISRRLTPRAAARVLLLLAERIHRGLNHSRHERFALPYCVDNAASQGNCPG